MWNLKKKEFFKIGINEQLLILDELYFKKIAEEIFKETNKKVKSSIVKKDVRTKYTNKFAAFNQYESDEDEDEDEDEDGNEYGDKDGYKESTKLMSKKTFKAKLKGAWAR